jgi:hypothetical protein
VQVAVFCESRHRDSQLHRDLDGMKFAVCDACARLVSTSREVTASVSPSRPNA